MPLRFMKYCWYIYRMPTEKQLVALAAGRAKLAQLAAAAGMTPQRYARTHRRQITLGEAQRAFEKFYNPSTQITRGPRKGQPRFKSPRGVKMAKTYDQNHTSRTVTDTRYLRNPGRWDFAGVDTGSKVRKPPTEAQLRARQALATRRRALPKFKLSAQAPEFRLPSRLSAQAPEFRLPSRLSAQAPEFRMPSRLSAQAPEFRPRFRLDPQASEYIPRGVV